MTRKRYQKLLRSEMTKLMEGRPGASEWIRLAAKTRAGDWVGDLKGRSYIEAWTMLRKAFTYSGNVPPIK